MALKHAEQLATMFGLAVRLAKVTEADALLVWSEGPADWESLRKRAGNVPLLIAGDVEKNLADAVDLGLDVVQIEKAGWPVLEKLSQALLQCVGDEILAPGAGVIAVYGGFESGKIDSVSFVELEEYLGRLTVRDLRELAKSVPLDTLRAAVDLAVEIGREGREGKSVGTLFVIGDTRKVLSYSNPLGFDLVKGYNRKERNLRDAKVRESVKELAQLDGAFVISPDGTIEGACHVIDISSASITLSEGLGTRHVAAAAITKKTNAISIAVSESSGTVRVFQDGKVVLRVEPLRRAMKWKDFDIQREA